MFQNKAEKCNHLKTPKKKNKQKKKTGGLAEFIAVLLTFDPLDVFLHVVKTTHQMLVMLIKILRL